jgi:hypothetical protein
VSIRNIRRSNDNLALALQSNQSERSKDESLNRNLHTSEMSFTKKIQLPHLAGLKRRRGRPPLAKIAMQNHDDDDNDRPGKDENIMRLKPTPIHSSVMQNVKVSVEEMPETPNFVDPNQMPR